MPPAWVPSAFVPYSLRRGGATELWRTTANLDAVVMAGRWRHATTARIYVSDGLAVLAEIRLTSPEFSAARSLCAAFCARFAVAPRIFRTGRARPWVLPRKKLESRLFPLQSRRRRAAVRQPTAERSGLGTGPSR